MNAETIFCLFKFLIYFQIVVTTFRVDLPDFFFFHFVEHSLISLSCNTITYFRLFKFSIYFQKVVVTFRVDLPNFFFFHFVERSLISLSLCVENIFFLNIWKKNDLKLFILTLKNLKHIMATHCRARQIKTWIFKIIFK